MCGRYRTLIIVMLDVTRRADVVAMVKKMDAVEGHRGY